MSSSADYPGAQWIPSPNYWGSRQGLDIQYIVVHGTSGLMDGCLNWLCSVQSGASVHYLVDMKGAVFQLVKEKSAAWGNGIPEPGSKFYGGVNPNLITVSIEAERDVGNTSPITDPQRNALISLCLDIRQRRGFLPIIPHSAISPQSRANCPGPDYPLELIDKESRHKGPTDITWVRFSSTPSKTPLVFYKDASFTTPLYPSAATTTTVLNFDGWQLGEAVPDARTQRPNRVWAHRHNPHGNQGWVPCSWLSTMPSGATP